MRDFAPETEYIMVKKRRLSPKSVWDEAELTAAFRKEGVKEYHVQKIHRCVQ